MAEIYFDDVEDRFASSPAVRGVLIQVSIVGMLYHQMVDRGITQRQLADKCGLSYSRIKRFFSLMDDSVYFDNLLKISSALGVTLKVTLD